jgi:phosphonate transport system substrate-binding protein
MLLKPLRQNKIVIMLLMFLALFSFILLPAESAQARELRLGAYKYLSDADMKKLLQPFTAFLSKSLNAPVKLYITSTYSELSQRFISGELDMAIIPPYAYVKLADKIKLKLLASMKLEGNYYYNGIIAVKKDSGINSLADFKGRKFAYVSPDSASGYLYPRILFKKTGLNPDALFKETQFTASHFDSVKALINGSVDGIAVFKDSINFAKMQGLDISGLKILEQTENIPHEAFVTQYNMNDTFAKKIQEALTRFKYTEQDLKAITLSNKNVFKMEGWVAGTDSLYDPVREAQKIFPQNAADAQPLEDSTITIGFYPRSDVDSTIKSFQPLLDYLKKETGLHYKLVFSPNYLDVGNQLLEGNYKLSILTPVALVMTENKSNMPLNPILQRTIAGKTTYSGLIICKNDPAINTLADLKDKVFAFTEPDSISGRLYPLGIFKKNNIHLKTFFKKTYYSGCPKSAINDVISGRADACACTQHEFETLVTDPAVKKNLKILHSTPPIPSEYWTVLKSLDSKVTAKIKNALTKLNDNKELKDKVLGSIFYDGFSQPSNDGVEELREMLKKIM